MGLKKRVVLPSGVALNYHRVVSLNVVTNEQNIIEVASYTSQAKREEEKAALATAREAGEYPEVNVFIETQMFTAPYDQDMTVESAYGWLKEQPLFEGASDVIEEREPTETAEGGE